MTPREKTFHLVSLGCAKNTVDSDSMAQLLRSDGYRPVEQAGEAAVIVVNTCGFIASAREESISALREMASKKRKGQLLVAAGCLTQRYGVDVAVQVPGVDGILGTRRWMDIVALVHELREGAHPAPRYDLPAVVEPGRLPVLRGSAAGSSAYLKIADGCRRPCAFCAIPLIKGTVASRSVDEILADARALRDQGMRELILIAQDTTDYGHDLGMKEGLAELLSRLVVAVPDVDWVRVMYAYPGYVTDRLIDVMATHKQVLPYLDMPLQHGDARTLRRMRRPANLDWVRETVAKMRSRINGLTIRTTFLVGFPGETDEEFSNLLDFTREMRFDRVGAFQFSFEAGTTSEPLGDPIPAEVKQQRYDALMEAQQAISLQINQAYVGKTLDVLVEGREEQLSIGRSYRDAPEIDGLVLVEGALPVGTIQPVRITGAMPYDLTAAPLQAQRPAVVDLPVSRRKPKAPR